MLTVELERLYKWLYDKQIRLIKFCWNNCFLEEWIVGGSPTRYVTPRAGLINGFKWFCVVGSDDSADSDFEQSGSASSDVSALSEAVTVDEDGEATNKRKTR